jgi:hypothetical protein
MLDSLQAEIVGARRLEDKKDDQNPRSRNNVTSLVPRTWAGQKEILLCDVTQEIVLEQ